MALGKTDEGYYWTREGGLQHGGFESQSVIEPTQHITSSEGTVYDVLIVGGGYAGLAAARDLTNAGRSVLLIEGRDRVGGRSYTIQKDGFKYEMGGTWIYHTQPYTYRELMRYKINEDIITTRDAGHKNNFVSFNVPGSKRDVSHEEAFKIIGKAWTTFVDVDGQEGKTVCPLPYSQLGSKFVDRAEVEKWDALSCYDRYEDIKHKLSEEEQGVLLALIASITGGTEDLKNSGFWDMIRSHAINGHKFEHMDEIWVTYKLRDGSSNLNRKMFDEAVDCGLQFTFKTRVDAITQTSGHVEIKTRDGRIFKGRKAITTAPLNTLKSIKFNPPLSKLKQEASRLGHINFMTKAHAIVDGPDFASWNGGAYPNAVNFAYGDGLTPEGDTHLTGFGCDYRNEFVLEEHPERVAEAFENIYPMAVKKIVFHNWNTDPYTQGGPCFMPPTFMSKYIEALREREGNVFFANADWAHAWRNFIDGALEQGAMNGWEVLGELRKEDGLKNGVNGL